MSATLVAEESVQIPWDSIAKEISAGGKYLVQRNGEPTMVVLSFDAYSALLDELEDLTDALESVMTVAAIERGEVKTIPIEEVKRRIYAGEEFDE